MSDIAQAASAPGPSSLPAVTPPSPAAKPPPPKSSHPEGRPIPPSVRQKIEQAYDWYGDDWTEIEPYFQSRIAELQPKLDSQYLRALEIAFIDKELLEHSGHAGRVLRLAEQLAVRDVLKPGYAQYAFGGPSYGKLDPMKDAAVVNVHCVTVHGETLALDEFNNEALEAELSRLALEKLARMGLSNKALKTKALELRQDELDKIHRRMAALQARRDLLLDSYARDVALVGVTGV